jgi:Fic family protein
MSLHHENFVWPLELPGLKKLVLTFIAREAKLPTAEGFLTHQNIAKSCGVSESAARKFVGQLEREGYFVRVRVRGRGVSYRLTLPQMVAP